MTQQCRTAGTPLGAVGRGLVAGAVGTLAMDVVLYALPARRRQTRLRHLGILRRHLQLGRGTGGGAGRQAPVRQIRFSKRHRPAAELDPLPLDPRDPDIVAPTRSPAASPGLAKSQAFAQAWRRRSASRLPPWPSLLRGGRYVYGEPAGTAGLPGEGTATDSASPAFPR
jgi:hypothetical protein